MLNEYMQSKRIWQSDFLQSLNQLEHTAEKRSGIPHNLKISNFFNPYGSSNEGMVYYH